MKREAGLVAAQERSRRNLELKRQKLVEATATRQKVYEEWTEHGAASSKFSESDIGN